MLNLVVNNMYLAGIIVAVTAACSGDERDKLLQCGADFVMQKPFDLALFRAFMRGKVDDGT